MPDLAADLEVFKPTNNFGFSGTRMDKLDATEYTLVTLVFDSSGSTSSYRSGMIDAVKGIIGACKKSPRADNLLIRVVEFSDTVSEYHGFKRLSTVDENDYSRLMGQGGMTALYDATIDAVTAISAYGKTLSSNDYSVNGIIFVITDGEDNRSKGTPGTVKDALQAVVHSEALESLLSILIGVNCSGYTHQYLTDFEKQAEFNQYLNMGDATASKLAKLADFVSNSISSQSQSLGSGGPSKTLNF